MSDLALPMVLMLVGGFVAFLSDTGGARKMIEALGRIIAATWEALKYVVFRGRDAAVCAREDAAWDEAEPAEKPDPKCKCHARGERGEVVPVEVRDTLTGEPEIARYVCSNCWREIHPNALPHRLKAQQASATADAFALTSTRATEPAEPFQMPTEGSVPERLDALRALLAERNATIDRVAGAVRADGFGGFTVEGRQHAEFQAAMMEAHQIREAITALSSVHVETDGDTIVTDPLLCDEPVYPAEVIQSSGSSDVVRVVTGRCERCGRTEFEHGEVTRILDPNTGEHLGQIQLGADGLLHAVPASAWKPGGPVRPEPWTTAHAQAALYEQNRQHL